MSEETVNQKVTDAIAKPETTRCLVCGRNPITMLPADQVTGWCEECRRNAGHGERAKLAEKLFDFVKDQDNLPGTQAPYGYCPVCGAKGVQRERRPNGDDKCSLGHTYPSVLALPHKLPQPVYTSDKRQPCKCCGKDSSVRDFGLMCESCQRQSKSTINAEQLVTNLQKAADQDKEHVSNIRDENERIFERNRQAQAESNKRHWELVRAHQAEQDKATAARDKVLGDLQDARLHKDQLHRLYTAYLSNLLRHHDSRESDILDLSYALESARMSQEYFEKEVTNG